MAKAIEIDSQQALSKVLVDSDSDLDSSSLGSVASAVDNAIDKQLRGVTVEQLEDYSVKVTLPGEDKVTGERNVVVHLRDMTGEDLEAIERMSGGNIDRLTRIISRLCIAWGSKEGIQLPELKKARGRHITLLGAVFAKFLS